MGSGRRSGGGGCRRRAGAAAEVRRSGELGQEKVVQMWVRECEREGTGSSRMCFKSRRGHSERELVLTADSGVAAAGGARAEGEQRGACGIRQRGELERQPS
jgi:hypothetical protein